MRIHFQARERGPERLLGNAEVHFEEGPLAGMRLLGFSVWRSPEGAIYVTFPSRTKGTGADRRYFEYLRSVDDQPEAVRRIKAWIIDEYRKRTGATV